MTDKPKMYATDHYQWVQHKDGREQLQRAWIGDGVQEWRLAAPDDPRPPNMLMNTDAKWIGD